MQFRRWSLLCLTLALGGQAGAQVDLKDAATELKAGSAGEIRKDINGIVEFVDAGRSKIVFQDRQALLRVQEQMKKDGEAAGAKGSDKKPTDYEAYTYEALALPSVLSQITARELAYAWQKFQDRSRFAISSSVNGGMLNLPSLVPLLMPPYNNYSTACLLSPVGDVSTSVAQSLFGIEYLKPGELTKPKSGVPQAPDPLTSSSAGSFLTPDLKLPGKVAWKNVPDNVNLASHLPLHQIPVTQHDLWCNKKPSAYLADNLLDIGLPHEVYSPGIMACTPFGCLTDGSYPRPRRIDWNEVKRRQQLACNEVIKPAAKTYYKEVAAAIAKVPGGLLWSNRLDDYVGLYTVPVNHLPISVEEAKKTGTDLIDQIKNTEMPDALLAPNPSGGLLDYYNITKVAAHFGLPLSDSKSLGGTKLSTYNGKRDQVGVNKLEETKRTFPQLDINSQAEIGAASLFQVWAKPETVLDSKIQVFNFKSACIPVLGACPFPTPNYQLPINDMIITPASCTVLPTRLGTTTFAMLRYHYRWVSVPEGYAVPDISGTPVGMVSGRP